MISMAKKWITVLLILIAVNLSAQVKLSPLFSSNMVLQQGIKIPVWGWASPSEKVTVTLDKSTASVKAGKDHKFYYAKAIITGNNTIEVSCPEVQKPIAVRYGWANNPDDANLYNSAELPASTFRTDEWKGITE